MIEFTDVHFNLENNCISLQTKEIIIVKSGVAVEIFRFTVIKEELYPLDEDSFQV